ncbi:MAG: hypothetical protein JSV16_11165 [Candidatus Hydrogenedentota bacterium]|nr:MAG: hypothetical protein JSV16_11165 [Candidatus Hydrogenedentota bacterium]
MSKRTNAESAARAWGQKTELTSDGRIAAIADYLPGLSREAEENREETVALQRELGVAKEHYRMAVREFHLRTRPILRRIARIRGWRGAGADLPGRRSFVSARRRSSRQVCSD